MDTKPNPEQWEEFATKLRDEPFVVLRGTEEEYKRLLISLAAEPPGCIVPLSSLEFGTATLPPDSMCGMTAVHAGCVPLPNMPRKRVAICMSESLMLSGVSPKPSLHSVPPVEIALPESFEGTSTRAARRAAERKNKKR